MKRPRLLDWHQKLFRVVRRGWANPLDTSFSRRAAGQRWNLESFEALYCCGSEQVARAVTLDVYRFAGVVAADLQEKARPQLVEIKWSGELVDVYTGAGVAAGGFDSGYEKDYPSGVSKDATRAAAVEWRGAGRQGVCCRSASLARMGLTAWPEPANDRCEVALWPTNWKRKPKLIRRRGDGRWLRLMASGSAGGGR